MADVVDTVLGGGEALPYSAEGGFGSDAAEVTGGGEVELVGGKRRRFRMRKKNKTYKKKGKRTIKAKKSKGKKSKGKKSKDATCYVYKYVKRSCKNLKM
jgi:hypothetical protein